MGEALEHALAVRKRAALLAELVHGLDGLTDQQLAALDDPVGLGQSMVRLVVSAAGSFGQLVGPLYHAQAVEALLALSSKELLRRVSAGELLALQVEGEYLFPVFQFRGAVVREEVVAVVSVLRSVVDPFSIAQWLGSPQSDLLGGRTPLQGLESGDRALVLAAARRAATQWSA